MGLGVCIRTAAGAAALAIGVTAGGGAAAQPEVGLFAADVTADMVVAQVVAAVALEPDPAFAAMLATAAAEELGKDDPALLAELVDAVLLTLPEDAARRLAPRLIAGIAGRDEALQQALAAAAAPVVGFEAADLAGASGRAAATAAVPAVGEGPLPAADDVVRPARGDVLPLRLAEGWILGQGDIASWIPLLLTVRPLLGDAPLMAAAAQWGLPPEGVAALFAPPMEDMAEVIVIPYEVTIWEIPPMPVPGDTASPW